MTKRRILPLLTGALVAVLIAGCGGVNDHPTTAAAYSKAISSICTQTTPRTIQTQDSAVIKSSAEKDWVSKFAGVMQPWVTKLAAVTPPAGDSAARALHARLGELLKTVNQDVKAGATANPYGLGALTGGYADLTPSFDSANASACQEADLGGPGPLLSSNTP